jgi:hypothetical protein
MKGGHMAKNKDTRTKESGLHMLVSLVVWIAGVLVSLAVGFGMVDGTLSVMWIPDMITAVAGWIVVILTLLGVILAIIERFS